MSKNRRRKVNRNNVTTIETEDSVENHDNDDYKIRPETIPLDFDKEEEFGKEGEDDKSISLALK